MSTIEVGRGRIRRQNGGNPVYMWGGWGGWRGEGMGAWEGRSSKAEPYSASSGQPERSGGVTAGW